MVEEMKIELEEDVGEGRRWMDRRRRSRRGAGEGASAALICCSRTDVETISLLLSNCPFFPGKISSV